MSRLSINLDILGAITAIVFYVSAIMVFIFRLEGKPQVGYFIGIFEFCLAVPMIYLLIKAPENNRPGLYYVQISLMLIWLVFE